MQALQTRNQPTPESERYLRHSVLTASTSGHHGGLRRSWSGVKVDDHPPRRHFAISRLAIRGDHQVAHHHQNRAFARAPGRMNVRGEAGVPALVVQFVQTLDQGLGKGCGRVGRPRSARPIVVRRIEADVSPPSPPDEYRWMADPPALQPASVVEAMPCERNVSFLKLGTGVDRPAPLLGSISTRRCLRSRRHFVRITLPRTPHRLLLS